MKTETIPAGEPGGYERAKEGRAMTQDTVDAVERLAKLLCDADTTSWKNTADTQTRSDVAWGDMRDSTEEIHFEGISLGRDHYRTLARAIVNTAPPVAVTKAMVKRPAPPTEWAKRAAHSPWNQGESDLRLQDDVWDFGDDEDTAALGAQEAPLEGDEPLATDAMIVERLSALEAQVARLRMFAEEMAWYAPEQDWEDAARRLLRFGDVRSIPEIYEAAKGSEG